MLRAVFVAVALTGCATTAAADDGSRGAVGGAGDDAPGDSSKPGGPADSRFHLDALELNVYGLSYHPDREAVHRQGVDNQVNPGLALHYEMVNDARGVTFTELGGYRDSGRNLAKFVALGYQFKLGERWRIGGALAAMDSKTYNNGVAFVGMIPLVTYDAGPIKLNAVYFPKFANYNEIAAYGFYVTLPVGRWLQ